MEKVSFKGGSRIGWVNASFPFATLECSRERITLISFGKYEFLPDEVVSFDTYGSIPVVANGLRIHHNRLDYPEKVVFWCMGSRAKVTNALQQTGFKPSGQVVERPKGIPIRWMAIIGFVLIWNLLFMLDGPPAFVAHAAPKPGLGAIVALLLTFALATGIKHSGRVRNLVLAPGHTLGEVRGVVSLLQLVSGALGAAFCLAYVLAKF
jgi:hypothetical protein